MGILDTGVCVILCVSSWSAATMPVQQRDDLKRALGDALAEQCIGIRQRRRLVEERWLRSRRVWMNIDLERRFHSSDSSPANYNIPAARRAAERTIVRGIKLLTPNVKWFEVAPMADVSEIKLSNIDKFMWYILRKRIKSRSIISQLVRSMLIYGTCHIKTAPVVRNGKVWPGQRAIDPFAYYIFPETAPTTDDAEVEFEDFLFSYERYKTYADKGILEPLNRSDLTKPDWPYHLVERLAYQGITDPTANVDITVQGLKDKVSRELEQTTSGFASLTEMWITREDKLFQVYILWNHRDHGPRCVGFFESQYDEPLYRSVVHRAIPSETYTNSMMADIDELDNIQNDLFNQFMEATQFEQGIIAMNNSARMAQRNDQYKMKGRALWELSDDPRNALLFMQPNITSTNQLRGWQIVQGLINAMAGTGTIAEGQPGRNMPRSGQAVNNLVTLGMADIQDVAELIEQEVLTPGLGDIYKVASAFIPDDQLMRIPGGQGLLHDGSMMNNLMRKQDIIGDYEFEWVGSLQFQDEGRRSQQLLIFLNLLMNPQMVQTLQAQGYAPNMVELIRMIWRYGLGERGLSDVVVPLAKMQQEIQTDAQENSSGSGNSNQNSNGRAVPGLMYNLPSVTNGFVQQG